ncbi:long-chain-fatty-acid--CoA ligase [Thiothrix lacustris]|jgi:fatty-acyl-CoA synthase|uniref:Long-chain-fatty-acid--CoA ligase n=1 Tax=Thiothrix lacustris TaxID=525917 RepID=A0ABY9MSY3_9GAMM|nr:long-chain-fatty-acid--CoA ligase [Thiothrix lacustris]WML91766.1 long-chain-fatty-acid--CoA ligase [Thiothrix lacustris]
MFGQMMKMPLLISSLINHAEMYHGETPIVSVETAGGLTHTCWAEVARRSRKLASSLDHLGMATSECCGTIAWNNHRHLEIYFGVSGSGRVCHTINPRLFPTQLVYIINHAQDKILFLDKTFLPVIAQLRDRLPTVQHFVLMSAQDEEAASLLPGLLFYEDLIAQGDENFVWPELDEQDASSLCYTSGTTGDPKGVLYSHRSTLLHSFAIALPDSMGLSARETILPVVPMFHVNAWGVPYAAAMVGAALVMPGPGLDGGSLLALIDGQHVTLALGVPTIWQGLLRAMEKSESSVPSLRRTIIGGAACPPSMISTFRDQYQVETIHAWGMTELSPVGTVNHLLRKHEQLSEDDQWKLRASQGRPLFGIELRLMGDGGDVMTPDGVVQGNLQCRGHWVVDTYFKAEDSALEEGWFSTGDVSTLDEDGYMTIRDRSKDIIKSGGEWISTVELENIAVAHPEILSAAAIAAKHVKWDERPLLIVVKREGSQLDAPELLRFFEDKIAKWQIPDDVVFVEALPMNATGKLLKNKLRETYGDYLLKKNT